MNNPARSSLHSMPSSVGTANLGINLDLYVSLIKNFSSKFEQGLKQAFNRFRRKE